MEAKEYSKLLHLIENAREKADELRGEMKILNRHECACADAQIVHKVTDDIEKGLSNALVELRKMGEDVIIKVSGESP